MKLRVALACVVVALGLAACHGGPHDIGYEGHSYDGASGSPSGSKPQSKLWWNDGSWWAALFNGTTDDHHIYRLDQSTQRWVDTGTKLDLRTSSRADVLWDGTTLYVAFHRFSESPALVSASDASVLRRYSYNADTDTYTLDAGYPQTINSYRTEALVIDKDSTGRLWATWVQPDSTGASRVFVSHTTVGDQTWATPFALPSTGTAVSSDDISSIMAFGGNRVGVLWSNQNDDQMYFSSHLDSLLPSLGWTPAEVAYGSPGSDDADDHINLASIQDTGGRVFAAVKTSNNTSNEVQVHLLERDPVTGWESHVYGLGSDDHTRPIVVVDGQNRVLHVYATAGESGGSIYEKTRPIDGNTPFPTGVGTPVIRDVDSLDANNAASTKQVVNSITDLVVIATNDTTRRYWHSFQHLPEPAAPPAA